MCVYVLTPLLCVGKGLCVQVKELAEQLVRELAGKQGWEPGTRGRSCVQALLGVSTDQGLVIVTLPGMSSAFPSPVGGVEEWFCLSDPCKGRLQPARTKKAAGAD